MAFRSTIIVSVVGLLSACARPRPPLPSMPHLAAWKDKSLTICCRHSVNDLDCTTESWTQTIQSHCKGKAQSQGAKPDPSPLQSQGQVAQCLSYRCEGELKPYERGTCGPTTLRRIPVVVIVDPSYTTRVDWSSKIQTAFSHTNFHFKPLGIWFDAVQVSSGQLISEDSKGADDIFKALRRLTASAPAEIRIGLYSKRTKASHWAEELLGRAEFLKGELILNQREGGELSATLVHELGHVFGAFHVSETSSIMYHNSTDYELQVGFDKANQEIFRITHCADLSKGVHGLAPVQLSQIGVIFQAASTSGEVSPLVSALEDEIGDAIEQKQEKQALAAARRIDALVPGMPHGPVDIGWVYQSFKKYGEAKPHFEEAVRRSRLAFESGGKKSKEQKDDDRWNLLDSLRRLGESLRGLNDRDAASRTMNEALQLDPGSHRVNESLGWWALEDKNYLEAIYRFERALKRDPDCSPSKKGLEEAKAGLKLTSPSHT